MAKKTPTQQTLNPAITADIRQLCQQGYQHYDNSDIKAAIRKFYTAWNLIPKPQTDWREAGWVLTALGDAYVAKGDYKNGRESLLSALHCPDTSTNPIILLQLGQCQFELGDKQAAGRLFEQVIKLGGEKLFKKMDKQYLALIKHSSPA